MMDLVVAGRIRNQRLPEIVVPVALGSKSDNEAVLQSTVQAFRTVLRTGFNADDVAISSPS